MDIEKTGEVVKKPLWFFTVTEDKQKPILLKGLPLLKPFFTEFRRLIKQTSGGEAVKVLAEANAAYISADTILANKNDALVRAESKNRETDTLQDARDKAYEVMIDKRIALVQASEKARIEEQELGLETLESVITNVLEIHYDNAVELCALFNNQTRAQLAAEKDIFEIAEMLMDIVENDKIMAVFTRWRGLKFRTLLGS